ncbi:unnamed protein product [Ixodes hexagonus]
MDILQQTDDNGDRIVLWCRPGEREEDGYCIVCDQTINCSQLYCVDTRKKCNICSVPNCATVFTSYYARYTFQTHSFIFYLPVMLGGASFYRGYWFLAAHAKQFLFCHLLWVI